MTTNSKASVAIVIGTLCGMVTMLLHPTGHDVTRSVVDGGHGSLNVFLHSIALLGQPLIVMGMLALTLQFTTQRALAVGAFVLFAWASVAVMIASAASGFMATSLIETTVREQGAARDVAYNALHYTGLLNRTFSRIFVAFSALAILTWSIALLREAIFSRSLAVYGIVSACAVLAMTLSGHLRFDIHGFGAVVLVQAIWCLWIAAQLAGRGSVLTSPLQDR